MVFVSSAFGQSKPHVIAYYSGGAEKVSQLPAEKLSHIIFSFCHLKGNELKVDNASDSLTILALVKLKARNPALKIMLSLGGWGGCKTCSDVFSSAEGRTQFTKSVMRLTKQYHTDGLDLDWEYPTIAGYPEHPYKAEDKQNFTALAKSLRKAFGKKQELSFAAGGFQKFLDDAVDWKEVMRYMDRVNLMTYDLVSGYSKQTGHHTALYSNPNQKESGNNAIQHLISIGVPREKIVLGAAFYARVWANVAKENNGLYQLGEFKDFVAFNQFEKYFEGFTFYWDDASKAPYAYHPDKKLFGTFDNQKSLTVKTQYVLTEKLGGLMFWELPHDTNAWELVNTIQAVIQQGGK